MSASRRHALITGGNSGIGTAIAEALWGSHDLTLLGRDAAKLDLARNSLPGAAHTHTVTADVTDPTSLAAAIEDARRANGPITVLVNNAGRAHSGRISEATPETVRAIFDVNLGQIFETSRLVLPDMIAAGFGRIVNIASVGGLKGYPYVTIYCAAKHGVVGMTRALALEVVRKAVTVNAICPGYTDTTLVEEQVRSLSARTGKSSSEVLHSLLAETPLGRMTYPDEVAQAVSWLVQESAASVTGQAIVLAGGEYMAG
jgi:NAD(P)-dependent dehydrogenase (short-subunit alcohol dehydrogenase family)